MKKVLFLCVGNSCRSQMAEGLLNYYGKGRYTAFSAGSKPEERVNPFAVKVMAEIGIDISEKTPKHVNIFSKDYFDYVITVCGDGDETCPVFLGKSGKEEHYPFPDPAEYKGSEEEITNFYRKVRNNIKEMVLTYFKIPGDNYEHDQ